MKSEMTIDKNENQIWLNENGERHRLEDLPAYVGSRNDLAWWVNGKLFRENDKPPIIRNDGSQEWWMDKSTTIKPIRLLHRTTGPAVIYTDGRIEEWWINGEKLSSCAINQWMAKLEITYPFDEEYQALFLMTFGG